MSHAQSTIAIQLALALSLAGPTLRAQDSSAPPIDVGLITEPTAHHRTGYLNVLASLPGVRRVAVVDATGKSLADAKKRLGPRYYGGGFENAAEMLREVRPRLTVVTMEGVHAPAAVIASLKAGSHVLTEKPSCTKLEQFEEIAVVAKRQRRHVMLAMATRSSPLAAKAKALIAKGAIGKPYSISMMWHADQTRLKNPMYHKSWVADPKRAGGGKLIYHGIHFLDLIQFLLEDDIERINGFTANVGGEPIQVEDSAVVSFRMSRGATGVLNTGYYLERGKQTEIRIWGSKGWLLFQLHKRQLQWRSTAPGASREVETFVDSGPRDLYQLFFREAVESIRNNRPPAISTSDSLQALRVVFAGYAAAESGRTQMVRRGGE